MLFRSFAIPSVDLKNVVETGKFGGKPAQIKMLWMYSANPLNTHTDTQKSNAAVDSFLAIGRQSSTIGRQPKTAGR